jgi:outer membrane protein insertion porin family
MEGLFKVNAPEPRPNVICNSDGVRPEQVSPMRIDSAGLRCIKRGGILVISAVMALLVSIVSGCATSQSRHAEKKPKAQVKITGYGILGDRNLKKLVALLQGKLNREYYDANFIEDTALILTSQLNRDGYLHPWITAVITTDDGGAIARTWTGKVAEPLPQSLRARKVEFQVHRGVLYYYTAIKFIGLNAIHKEKAESFFRAVGALIPLRRSRAYTADNLRRGEASLKDALERQGFHDAEVKTARLDIDDHSGKVRVLVQVNEGMKWMVRSVRVETFAPDVEQPALIQMLHPAVAYSQLWLQDFTQSLRVTNYHKGLPDVAVTITTQKQELVTTNIQLDLLAKITTGPVVRIGKVEFTGEKKTRESVMVKTARQKPGDLLDRTAAEQGRFRLARLGVFDTVDLQYKDVDERTRDLIYRVNEGKEITWSLLAGYGAYDLLQGGVEVEDNNIFGRAHHADLRLVQSFKTSSADFTYTVPEVTSHDVDAFLSGSALRRQEISFLREEYGASSGLHEYFKAITTDATLRYNYQILDANQAQISPVEGLQSARDSSVTLDLKHNREDNPLYPRAGYRLSGTFEVASDYLGGNANYERFELIAAYHHSLGPGHWLHLGLSHGAVFTPNGPEVDLPFNKRFFPGGAESVRGYEQGEAAPRDALGNVVGAESYVLANVEFEQALTESLSLVVFSDSVGLAHSIRNYPASEGLYSVGGGIYWKTPIGPVRLEYGYNLNRRPQDPTGTIQFSVGFPF